MGKYGFIKNINIVPVAKRLELEYQEVGKEEIQKLTVNVWPYTVEEKLELQNLNEESKKVEKTDPGKYYEILNDLTIKSIMYVLKKDDPEITIEDIKKMPPAWYNKIATKALSWEGISEEVIEEQSKKAIDEKLKSEQ